MIESLTLIKNTDEKGDISYTINGALPLEEAAKMIVIIAFNAERPKKEEVIIVPKSDAQTDPGTG